MKKDSKKTILLVEDDPLVSQMYTRRLEKEGIEVILASDGIEGLEKLKSEKIDLVLLDIMMPKMNGYEMLKRVRENPQTRDMPVMVLTNLNDRPEEIDRIKALGIEEYVLKSDTKLSRLAEKVDKYLKL